MSQDYDSVIKRKCTISRAAILVMLFAGASLVTSQTLVSVPLNVVYAESGIGKDVFKVVVSVFGVTKETGDIAAAVTVNGESKVKSFDVDRPNLQAGSQNSSESSDVVEFVATFPDVLVNVGDQYNACVMTLKTMDKYCEEGHNSPAKRPEFVDLTIGKAIKSSDLPEKKSKVKDEITS